MLTLYSYSELFGVADNNGYGLKVFALLARGLADLRVLADLLPAEGYFHGPKPTTIDCGIYGFIANIWFYDIETPLKQFVSAQQNLVGHCEAMHAAVNAVPVAVEDR